MSILHALILGAIQGLTEFLPISSDGHLVLAAHLLGTSLEGRSALGFDILLHGGSLLALLILDVAVWWKLLMSLFTPKDREGRRTVLMLIVATIPAVIAGLLLEDIIALQLRSITAAAAGFLITAIFLVTGERVGKNKGSSKQITALTALVMGCLQAFAILPGVSRSGSTISAGRVMGLNRRDALNFSFLMAVPIIAGAIAKTLLDAFEGTVAFPPLPVSVIGFVASFIVSLGAITFLRRMVSNYSLAWFAVYLIPLAMLLLYWEHGLLSLFSIIGTIILVV